MKFLLMIALAISVSCSKSPNSNNIIIKNDTNPESTVIDFGEVTISVPLSGIVPSSSLDFASLAYKQSGTQDLKITYSPSSGRLVLAAADFDTSLIAPFSIQSNGCITTLLPRKSCIIKFQLNNSQSLPSDQNLTSLIKIKGSDISLTGILKQDLTDYSAPVTVISVSPLSLNFGSFKNGESKELSIAVKNNGSDGSAISLSAISNPNVSISFNSCPVSPLLLGARVSCVVRLKYLGAAAEVKNNENLMKIANYQVTHSATVISPSQEEPEVLTIVPQVSSSNVAMNQPDNQSRTISFTNSGTVALVAPVSAVSSDNGIQIVSVSCAGGLARSKICDISYNIISSQLPAGSSTQTIKLQSGTLASNIFSLNMEVVPNELPCTLADVSQNGVNLSNSNSSFTGIKIGANISQCLLASNACNQYYSLSNDSKSCEAVSSVCSPSDVASNGWNISQALSYSGNRVGSDISSCSVSSCNLNYEINAKDCTEIACTQANSGIANVLTVTGTKVSGCLIATCQNEYAQVGNLCNAVSCTTANAVGNGLSSVNNVSSVSGTINNDSCLVSTCDQYYLKSGDSKSCTAQTLACTSSDVTANGWNINQALSYSGNRVGTDISACSIATCNTNYEVSGQACSAIACTQANSGIANVLTVSGTKVSGCQVATCLDEYEKIGNTCSAISCTLGNSEGNGITSIDDVATVMGTINNDSCRVATCNQYFQNSVDNRSCEQTACALNNLNQSSVRPFQVLTVSGNLPACLVESCTQYTYEIAADDLGCDPVVIGLTSQSPSLEVALKSGTGVSRTGLGGTSSNTVTLPTGGVAPALSAITPTNTSAAPTNSVVALINTPKTSKNISQATITYNGIINRNIQLCQEEDITFTVPCTIGNNSFSINFNVSQLANFTTSFDVLLDTIPVTIPFKKYQIKQVSNLTNNGSDAVSDSVPMVSLNSELYFVADSTNGSGKLHKLKADGAIVQLTNIRANSHDGVQNLIAFNNAVYFQATTGTVSCGTSCIEPIEKLFRVNSDNTITRMSNTRNSVSLGDYPTKLFLFGDSLYYTALTGAGPSERVFKINTSGVSNLAFNIRSTGDLVQYPTIFNGSLYFQAATSASATALRLYRYTTANVLNQISNFSAGTNGDSPWKFTVHNGAMYFRAINSANFNKMFKLNTSNQIIQVSNTAGAALADVIDLLTSAGTDLFFTARNSSSQIKLFKLNASDVITQVSNFNTAGSDSISNIIYFNNTAYFVANNSSSQSKLFKVNANNSITQVTNTSGSDASSDSIANLTIVGTELYFTATNSSGHTKLHKINQNDEISSFSITDSNSDYIYNMTVHAGELYFVYQNPVTFHIKLFKVTNL